MAESEIKRMAECDFSDDVDEIVSGDSDSNSDWEPEENKDPEVIEYRKEVAAYEGFYVSASENITRKFFGGVVPCYSESYGRVSVAAKFAIDHYNQTSGESLEFEEVIRSNWTLTSGNLYYITFRATNGKFYETKVCVGCEYGRAVMLFCDFLRPAKHYPNLAPLSSSESSSSSNSE